MSSPPAVHWGAGNSDLVIRLREGRIHRITPTADINIDLDDDDLDTCLRADTPDVWGVIINDSDTFTLNVSGASSSGDQNISVAPETAMIWWLSGQTGGQGIYTHGWSRSLNSAQSVGYDSGRGNLSEDEETASSSYYCAVYRFTDCDGVESTFYSVSDYNIYVNRIVTIDGSPGVCWRVARVKWDNQTLTNPTIVNVYLGCQQCSDSTAPTFNCEDCINMECDEGVLVLCDGGSESCQCDGYDYIWYDGALRDKAYFTSIGAGAFCRGDQKIYAASCEGCAATCTVCAWCFENGRYEDQAITTHEDGCSTRCCCTGSSGICSCIF